MARRTRKPLLPILIFGSQKRTYHHGGQVSVHRVYSQTTSASRTVEDLILATCICLGMALYLVTNG